MVVCFNFLLRFFIFLGQNCWESLFLITMVMLWVWLNIKWTGKTPCAGAFMLSMVSLTASYYIAWFCLLIIFSSVDRWSLSCWWESARCCILLKCSGTSLVSTRFFNGCFVTREFNRRWWSYLSIRLQFWALALCCGHRHTRLLSLVPLWFSYTFCITAIQAFLVLRKLTILLTLDFL